MHAGDRNRDALLLNCAQTAYLTSLSERTIRSLVASGDLGSVRIGRRRLIPRAALAEFIEARVSGSHEELQAPWVHRREADVQRF